VTHVVCFAGDGIDGALTVTMEREGWACARTKWSSGVARQWPYSSRLPSLMCVFCYLPSQVAVPQVV